MITNMNIVEKIENVKRLEREIVERKKNSRVKSMEKGNEKIMDMMWVNMEVMIIGCEYRVMSVNYVGNGEWEVRESGCGYKVWKGSIEEVMKIWEERV